MIEVVAHAGLEDGEEIGRKPVTQRVGTEGAERDGEQRGDGSGREEKAFHKGVCTRTAWMTCACAARVTEEPVRATPGRSR